jgi:hypothetical protein
VNKHRDVAFTLRPQRGIEIRVGVSVACPTSYEQYPSKHQDRVRGQVGLAEQCDPQLVVTDNVPAMQRMFISEVRDELRDLHSSPRPWNDTLGIHVKDSGNQSPHSLLFGIEAKKEILMFHGLERRFTFFKATGHWH